MPSPIEHIVVLMMENRSFDHMLGWLPGVGELTGEEYNLLQPDDPTSRRIVVQRGAAFRTEPDPAHDLADVNRQLFLSRNPVPGAKPGMGGFAWNYAQQDPPGDPGQVMNGFTPEQLPALNTLAREFSCCRRWFSAVPGPTGPNRLFTHCATSSGYAGSQYEIPVVEPDQLPGDLASIFEDLSRDGLTWAIYYNDFSTAAALDAVRRQPQNFHDFSEFYQDVEADRLAHYSFLTPRLCPDTDGRHPDSQHPVYDARPGDELIADVYEAIRNQPSVWEKTLLVLLYDEHGGFYDSVAPPQPVVNPDGKNYAPPPGFDFTRLGVRVPAIVVSAYSPSRISDTQYEHASLPATIRRHFKLTSPALSRREAAANGFEALFALPNARPDTPRRLPRPKPMADHEKTLAPRPLFGLQQELLKIAHDIHQSVNLPHPMKLDKIATDFDAGNYLRKSMKLLLG